MTPRQGVLEPQLVGTLLKQGREGKMSLSKWKARRFELQGGSLYYYRPQELHTAAGHIELHDGCSLTEGVTLSLLCTVRELRRLHNSLLSRLRSSRTAVSCAPSAARVAVT